MIENKTFNYILDLLLLLRIQVTGKRLFSITPDIWSSNPSLDEEIGRLDEEIKKRMLPFEEDLALLDTIPGVARRTAETIAAEIGLDLNQYPSAAHLCSWAGMCPG